MLITRKGTQRDRLLHAMAHVAAHDGYTATTVTKVIAQAGVSRPTFYDYFTNREDCFVAALAGAQEQALIEIRRVVAGSPPKRIANATIAAMIEFADSNPTLARLLTVEALTGAPRAMDARDRTTEAIAQPIETALSQMPAGTPAADISARVMVGAVERLLAARLKHGKPVPAVLLGDTLGWIEHYEQPLREHRWRSLRPVARPQPSPLGTRMPMPPPLAPGRPRLSKEDVEANHRRRILLATAQASAEKSFTDTTVAEITALAGVDNRVFQRLFHNKQQLLGDLFELSFQHVMTVTAGAFFTAKGWPERVWDAGRTLTQCFEQNPTLAHIAFIETYVGGPAAVRRAEGFLDAFTLFLRDGATPGPRIAAASPPLPALTGGAVDAIAAAAVEIIYRQVRASSTPELGGLLAHLTHLTLTPFLGSAAVNDFIQRKRDTER